MSNNATKSDLKNTADVDPSKFAKKTDFASLESEIYKLFKGKLVSDSAGLIKLSSVVENNVIKTTVYDSLVKNFNAIQTNDTRNLLRKTGYDKKSTKLKKNA